MIDADELKKELKDMDFVLVNHNVEDWIDEQPTVDAVPVVRCHECIMHNKCNTEEAYKLCRIENPFCCVGKHMEPQTEAVEENSFLMQRFMKQE